MRYYSSIAVDTVLVDSVTADSVELPVGALIGYPSQFPFTIALDPETVLEELCDVTAIDGTVLTVTRAVDSTVPVSHAVGAKVKHVISGRDLREAQEFMVNGVLEGGTI